MKHSIAGALVAAAAILVPSAARADVVQLGDGTALEGHVRVGHDALEVDQHHRTIRVDPSDVVSIELDDHGRLAGHHRALELHQLAVELEVASHSRLLGHHDAQALFDLAGWARENGARLAVVRSLLERAHEAAPGSAAVHAALADLDAEERLERDARAPAIVHHHRHAGSRVVVWPHLHLPLPLHHRAPAHHEPVSPRWHRAPRDHHRSPAPAPRGHHGGHRGGHH